MIQAYCEICRLKQPTVRRLISHYISKHSKFKLAREILRLSVLKNTPKVLLKKNKIKADTKSENKKKAETLFLTDNIHILYRDNELIIRDDKSSVDMEFSFDENSCDSKDFIVNDKQQYIMTGKDNGRNINNNEIGRANKIQYKYDIPHFKDLNILQTSSSSVSSEDLPKKFSFRKRIRKRRDTREKARHYKVNITRLNNNWSLNETTGDFYYCTCRDDKRKGCSNDMKITSDTESASDTGKISNDNYNPKVFCSKCGNGYREESMLLEHMKIHETHCRVCNEIFPTEQSFKQHIQSHLFKVFVCHICNYEFPVKAMLHRHLDYHVEDSIMESVIDMEEDYNLTPRPLPNMSYQTSITNILHYLGDTNDMQL